MIKTVVYKISFLRDGVMSGISKLRDIMFIWIHNQMLGCGAHVRKIALPHVRCACEVRAERFLELCVRCACVRLVFGSAMCDRTFAHFFEQKDKISALFIYRFQTNNLFTYFGSFKHFVPDKNMICIQ